MKYVCTAILWVLTLVEGADLFAQTISFKDSIAAIQNIEEAKQRQRLLIQLASHARLKDFPDTLALLFHHLAYAEEDLRDFEAACNTNKRALQLRMTLMERNPDDQSRETFCRSAFNLSRNFLHNEQRDSALYYYNLVISISPVNRQKSKSAFDIGKIYLNEREFSLAHRYALASLNYAKSDSLNFEIQNAFILILDVFNVMFHDSGSRVATDSILRYVHLAKMYFQELGDDIDIDGRIGASKVLFFESNALKARDQPEDALRLLEEAQQQFSLANIPNVVYESELYNSKGILLRRLRQYEAAKTALTHALKLREQAGEQIHVAVTHNNLGDLYRDQGLHANAITHYHASIQSLTGKQGLGGSGEALSVNDIRSQPLHGDLFKYVGYEAQGWWNYYKMSKDVAHCQQSLLLYAFADSLVDVMRSQHLLESSKLLWREDAKQLYAGAIEAACEIKDYPKALYFSDRSKAVLVLDAVREHLQRDEGVLQLREKRDSLREVVIDLEKSGNRSEEWLKSTAALDQIQKQLGNTPSSFDQVSRHFSAAHVSQLQKQLGSDEVIIEYFDIAPSNRQNRDTLYAFVISSEGIRVVGLQHGEVMRALIAYHATIRAFIEKGIAPDQGNTSDSLYELLIKPLGPLPANITIIPDGALAQVGFDGLRDDNGRFLIESKSIRYDLSLAMASLMSQKKSSHDRLTVLAFAPMTEDFCDLRALPFTRNELKGISGIVRSQLLFGSAATTDQLFLNPSSRILHLATHASANVADPGSSWIAFAGDTAGCDVLYVRDLYTRYLPSSMVVVSACEGAYGVYAAGEGPMSVARGFAYAGAKSIVTSLWQVNDAATAEIMTAFYNYLAQGQTKSEALRQAKLDYIQDERRKKMELHPAWWSAFIVIGNDSELALQSANRFPVTYLVFGLIGVLVAFVVWWNKQKARKREGEKKTQTQTQESRGIFS